jgi:hypothetical protein
MAKNKVEVQYVYSLYWGKQIVWVVGVTLRLSGDRMSIQMNKARRTALSHPSHPLDGTFLYSSLEICCNFLYCSCSFGT